MKTHSLLISAALASLLAACAGHSDSETTEESTEQDLSARSNVRLAETDLTSDQPGKAANVDANLVNPWGMAFNAQGGVWVSNNHSATSTVYDVNGKLLLTVTVPTSPTSTETGAPTGQVFNTSTDFNGDKFIFADEHGTLSGWQPAPGTVLRSDQTASEAGYKGLAMADHKLFVTDFHNGKIDTFDASYNKIPTVGLVDPTIPHGYAPFNIQNLDGKLYVTYAQQDSEADDDVQGAGKGFVNVFETNGRLIGRIGSRGALNAPWGLQIAPATFGKLAGKLLVGNFGSGTIQAYDVKFTEESTGSYGSGPKVTHVESKRLGSVLGTNGRVLRIPALWGLAFSPVTGGLFFTAGPDDENHGLFGKLTIAK